MDGKIYQVCILENQAGSFCVGQTADLIRRMDEHNAMRPSKGKHTLKNRPWRLVWSEEHTSRSSAMRRERQIKSMKSARWIREHLLNKVEQVPARRD